jgi:polyphosphate kinase
MKLNNLTDEPVIDALYAASESNVRIDLLVRSTCSLRPDVKKLSKSIRVRSIVGRFLEHSRILYFQNGADSEFYLGSADMMQRNLDRRVEVLVRVKSPDLKQQMKLLLDLAFADNSSAWSLAANGGWVRETATPGSPVLNYQEQLMEPAGADA